MAQVIQRRSAANLIVSHARRTMSRASVSHEQIHQDAQQYLRKGVANAKQLTRDIEDKEEEVEDARSLIARMGLQLTRAAQAVKDDVFNKTERRAGDLVLNQIVPEGIAQMLSFGAQRKVSFALKLATRF